MKFRLVDQILAWQPYAHIAGVKAVSFEEYSLKAPFADAPRLPETLVLESFLQLGNWLILLSTDFQQIGMVIRINEVRFHDSLLPGCQMRMAVALARQREDGLEFSGEGRVNGRLVISGFGCLAVPLPAAEYVNPDDLRVLYGEIYQPEEKPS
jgi:3-hydroxymyristoyl/3-hydroxydecanoyl-(acyl carrier protein) dehydratase